LPTARSFRALTSTRCARSTAVEKDLQSASTSEGGASRGMKPPEWRALAALARLFDTLIRRRPG
jgi:hypothetical protein